MKHHRSNSRNSLHYRGGFSSPLSYLPLSFKNVQQQHQRNKLVVNRFTMMIATLSFVYYIILGQMIGYQCGDWSVEQEQNFKNKQKKLMPVLLTISIVYAVIFFFSLIYLIKTGNQGEWTGLLGIGIWCLISIIMVWSKKHDDKNIRCYHIIIMYITFIIYSLLLFSSFFGKKSSRLE